MFGGRNPSSARGTSLEPAVTADGDLRDLGRLEDALDELTAVPFARLREQEAALQVNASLGWKTDGKVHGCSSSWARRRDRLADEDQIRSSQLFSPKRSSSGKECHFQI